MRILRIRIIVLCYSLRPYKLIYVFSTTTTLPIKTREDKNSAKVKEINRETLFHCVVNGSDADVRVEMESEASDDQLATNM